MYNRFLLLISLILLWASCNEPQKPSQETPNQNTASELIEKNTLNVVKDLESAHQVARFKAHAAVSFDLELFFRGKKRFEGTIISTTDSDQILIKRLDGTQVLSDGKQVIKSPADADYASARFDIFTWQYFFMIPFKLNDPGTNWEALNDHSIEGEEYERGKLSFGTGVGDAPDDWYIVYKNKTTNLLDIVAYIVTYRQSQTEAEEEPHAISYGNYEMVDGIPFAKNWEFWLWTEEKGIFDRLGEANITNIKLIDDLKGVFDLPEDYTVVNKD